MKYYYHLRKKTLTIVRQCVIIDISNFLLYDEHFVTICINLLYSELCDIIITRYYSPFFVDIEHDEYYTIGIILSLGIIYEQ